MEKTHGLYALFRLPALYSVFQATVGRDFGRVDYDVTTGLIRIPYTHVVITADKS
jgi:hypothetical protein